MAAGPPPRDPTYCPFCAAHELQPTLVPLTMIEHELREGGKEYRYWCSRCGYEELQERLLG